MKPSNPSQTRSACWRSSPANPPAQTWSPSPRPTPNCIPNWSAVTPWRPCLSSRSQGRMDSTPKLNLPPRMASPLAPRRSWPKSSPPRSASSPPSATAPTTATRAKPLPAPHWSTKTKSSTPPSSAWTKPNSPSAWPPTATAAASQHRPPLYDPFMHRLVEANTAFALHLYGKLRSTAGNLALSPYSISSALAMTYAGACGDTAREMEQTLHFEPGKTGLHELFGRLAAALKAAQESNELSIANSVWPQEKYPFREEFLNLLKRDYGATVTPLDYEREAESARAKIN